MESVELVQSTKYTAEQVDSALLVMATYGGNAAKAARALKLDGMGITRQSLRLWRDRYPRRYAAIEREHAKKIEAVIVRKARANVLRLSDVEELALEKAQEELENGKVKDASTTLRNIAVAKGINISKILELEGRPTHHVVEHLDATEILRAIAARVTVLDAQQVIEGEAEEEAA
jgi:hypothetical protein